MASSFASPPVGSDGVPVGERQWSGSHASRFEWVSSAPSSAEIAELERLFPEIIQVPSHSLEFEADGWATRSIIARSLSRWVPPEVLIHEFHRAGVVGEIEAVALAHRHYIFRFLDAKARDFVLGRPWVANGQPIAIMEWEAEFVPAEFSVLNAMLWICLPLLPLEFWTEDILSSILSVAGEFKFVDEATKKKNRGGYARACVRVDLTKPFRPGVRVLGSKTPFWQQFCYENVEGIYESCGTLHFGGSCSMVPEHSNSSSSPTFGPWMAAIRRRRSTQESAVAFRSQGSGVTDPVSGSELAWQYPKRVARRQSGKVPVVGRRQSDMASAEGRSSPSSSLVPKMGMGGSNLKSSPIPAC